MGKLLDILPEWLTALLCMPILAIIMLNETKPYHTEYQMYPEEYAELYKKGGE